MSEEEAIEILKKCFEDIRGSILWRDEWQALDIVEEYIRNSISKDKIREKIELFENELEKNNENIEYTRKLIYTADETIKKEIQDLEELLEE